MPGTTNLACPYCAHKREIIHPTTIVATWRYREASTRATRAIAPRGRRVGCSGCGAVLEVTGAAVECPFCRAPVVLESASGANACPDGIIPFFIDELRAARIFGDWIKGRWFAPADISVAARQPRMCGVYVPHYAYDCLATASYHGQRGEHYHVTQAYRDSSGAIRQRQVRKTRWLPRGGRVSHEFRNVLVCGSASLPAKHVGQLEPWPLELAAPYAADYLAGFTAQNPTVELEQGFAIAKGLMEPVLKRKIIRDIGGDEQRITSYEVTHERTCFKLLLLPLWIASYRHRGRTYMFIINGKTGAGTGDRPWSAGKITLSTLALAALVALIAAVISIAG